MKTFIYFVVLLLASCGNDKDSSPAVRTTNIPAEEIVSIMENQKFDCAPLNGSRCPSGLARLLTINPVNSQQSTVCTGFLMSPSLVVTNQHCVPDQAICENTYLAVYNGSAYEQHKCLSVEKILNDFPDPNDPRKKWDVAVLKLESPFTGDVFGENFGADIASGDSVRTWVIDHTGLDKDPPNLLESRVTELDCVVAPESEREALLLNECPVMQGNSGSPIVKNFKDVVGIVWGGTALPFPTLDLELRRSLREKAAATEAKEFLEYAIP